MNMFKFRHAAFWLLAGVMNVLGKSAPMHTFTCLNLHAEQHISCLPLILVASTMHNCTAKVKSSECLFSSDLCSTEVYEYMLLVTHHLPWQFVFLFEYNKYALQLLAFGASLHEQHCQKTRGSGSYT